MNSTIITSNAPIEQELVQDMPFGPVSANIHAALIDLSSMVHLMGDQALDARKIMHRLFDSLAQVAELESAANAVPQEVGRAG